MDITTETIEDKMPSIIEKESDMERNMTHILKASLAKEISQLNVIHMSACPNNYQNLIYSASKTPDPDKLEITRRERFDYSSLQAISCSLLSLFYHSLEYYSNNFLFRQYIHNMKKIDEGEQGIVLSLDFGNTRNLFLLKSSIKEDLSHELSVGLNVANLARREIPNFAFVYGGFDCEPFIDSFNPINICGIGEDKIKYIMYEYVDNSVTLTEFISTFSRIEDVISLYIQSVLSVLYANQRFAFTHYDLHGENILVRNVNVDNFQIRYSYKSVDYFVKAWNIATIIDYGLSYYEKEGEGRSSSEIKLEQAFIYPDQDHPYHDIYKLFMSITDIAFSEDKTFLIKTFCIPVYEFFDSSIIELENDEEKMEYLLQQVTDRREYYMGTPKFEEMTRYTPQTFVIKLIELFPNIISATLYNGLEQYSTSFGDLDTIMADVFGTKDDLPNLYRYFKLNKPVDENAKIQIVHQEYENAQILLDRINFNDREDNINSLNMMGISDDNIYDVTNIVKTFVKSVNVLNHIKDVLNMFSEMNIDYSIIYNIYRPYLNNLCKDYHLFVIDYKIPRKVKLFLNDDVSKEEHSELLKMLKILKRTYSVFSLCIRS